MARGADLFDVSRLSLSSGEAGTIQLDVPLDELQFGGQRYAVEPSEPRVKLDATRTTSGYSFRLRFATRLRGPCMRCLENAEEPLRVDDREVDQPGGGEDLRSPYLDGDELNVRSWARDALVLALPTQIVCHDECLGLCAVCGANLNRADPGHGHEPNPDPRWAKLRELEIE